MPKRVCPFDFDFFPQQKIHVSEKEVNSGVLMKNHMKQPVVINTCQSCRQPVDNSPDKCSFCDKMVCGLCGSSCMKCCEVYCRCCSLPDFSSTEESCICIGCA
ncbi:apoptosis regulatory protein Siva-like isoform X2 [Schistocerca americana]|uniref:apoptosis regulatory protein Siva-like isoform X2 n=1 Tax=Schistocerca americana TaxID=7009 RepID=UPI001F4F9759|nr:apoptosis regulatory protein Siva-like isoform X2 [Schistocerca americana]